MHMFCLYENKLKTREKVTNNALESFWSLRKIKIIEKAYSNMQMDTISKKYANGPKTTNIQAPWQGQHSRQRI